MNVDPDPARLSRLTTCWSVLLQAQRGQAAERSAALQTCLERYSPAVFRYLLGATRDADAAADLFQEFALRFVRGDFRNADPGRGRFRAYLIRALSNLVTDRQRKPGKELRVGDDLAEPAAPFSPSDAARVFRDQCRQDLLDRAWAALEQWEAAHQKPYYRVLRLRTDHPDWSTAELATALKECLGQSLHVDLARKYLQLARERFIDLIVEQVEQTLGQPTREALIEELIELDLYEHCRKRLES